MEKQSIEIILADLARKGEEIADGLRSQLLQEAQAVINVIEGHADVISRAASTSDLVAQATYFSAQSVKLNCNFGRTRNGEDHGFNIPTALQLQGGNINLQPIGARDEDCKVPDGDYTLVVALLPRRT